MYQRHVSWRRRWLAASTREQLNITVESFCVANTITSLENRMYCTTGTNTSSGIIFKHAESKWVRPTYLKAHCVWVRLCFQCYLTIILKESRLPKKSPQNVYWQHGTRFSATISKQLNDSTEMNPAPLSYLIFESQGGEWKQKSSDPKGPNDIILTFHWTPKTFPLQQWGHRESLRIEQVSWTNMPWNRK